MITVAARRCTEMILGCIVASALFNFFKINSNLKEVITAVKFFEIFIFILYMMYNGYMLRNTFFKVEDSFDFYMINIVSIIVFSLIVTILWVTLKIEIYAWFFSITNIFSFVITPLGNVLGAILFYLSLFVTVFISNNYYASKI